MSGYYIVTLPPDPNATSLDERTEWSVFVATSMSQAQIDDVLALGGKVYYIDAEAQEERSVSVTVDGDEKDVQPTDGGHKANIGEGDGQEHTIEVRIDSTDINEFVTIEYQEVLPVTLSDTHGPWDDVATLLWFGGTAVESRCFSTDGTLLDITSSSSYRGHIAWVRDNHFRAAYYLYHPDGKLSRGNWIWRIDGNGNIVFDGETIEHPDRSFRLLCPNYAHQRDMYACSSAGGIARFSGDHHLGIAGDILWENNPIAVSGDHINDLDVDGEGNVYYLQYNSGGEGLNLRVGKVSHEGSLLWETPLEYGNYHHRSRIAATRADGVFVYVNNWEEGAQEGSFPYLIRINENGGVSWVKSEIFESPIIYLPTYLRGILGIFILPPNCQGKNHF